MPRRDARGAPASRPGNPRRARHFLSLLYPNPDRIYPIDDVSRMLSISRRRIALYCLWGLVQPFHRPEEQGWAFAPQAIRTLRQIDEIHRVSGANREVLRIIVSLMREVERLRQAAMTPSEEELLAR